MLEICMCSLRPELLPDTFLKTPKVNLCWVRSVWQVVGYTVHVLWFVFRFGSIAGADIRAQAAGAHRLNVSKLVLVWTWTDWRSEGCCWVEQPGCWCRGYKRLTEQQFLGVGGGVSCQWSYLSVLHPEPDLPLLWWRLWLGPSGGGSHECVLTNTVTPDPSCSCTGRAKPLSSLTCFLSLFQVWSEHKSSYLFYALKCWRWHISGYCCFEGKMVNA